MRKVLSEVQDGTFARNWILKTKQTGHHLMQ